MMSRDASRFSSDRCGGWPVSAMCQDTGVTFPSASEPCEFMAGSGARLADIGYGAYVHSEYEPLLAVFPHDNGHARAREQLDRS